MEKDELRGALELQWINKDMALMYDIDEEKGCGIKPEWVEKEHIRVREPRILKLKEECGSLENENILIRGDNLLALRTLVEIFKDRDEKDKVKCIYIDPPFNTGKTEGGAFDYYDDNLEHSQWLTMIRDRLLLLKQLLREDGVIFIHLDDIQSSNCRLLMEELFGRSNFCNEIILATNNPFGYKSTAKGLFKQANHILFCAKNKSHLLLNDVFVERDYDQAYHFIFDDISKPESERTWSNLFDVVAKNLGFSSSREAKRTLDEEAFMSECGNFALSNADRVFRTASVTGGALQKRRETILHSKQNKNVIIRHPNDDMDYMFIGGERVLFYGERLATIDGLQLPGVIITDLWTDVSVEGIASEGGVDFSKSKKPERLIQRIISLTTTPGDLVLDSFLGSGTTCAVAHKMNRRWIGIELGKHAETLCLPRLKRVLTGEDQTGISKSVNWGGGGGFRYYVVGDSVIKSGDMNWDMTIEELAEAVFMNFGFTKMDTELKKGVFVGKARKKGRFALCSVTKSIEIVKMDGLTGWLDELRKKHGEWSELEIYTNKGVGVRSDSLPEGVVLKKIPESILAKYNL